MIEDEGKYYLYRHIRLDKNEVFYIGIGTKSKNIPVSFKTEFRRAFAKTGRSSFWKGITSKTDFRVEILFQSNDRKFIENQEIEFIKLYGRRTQKLGTLVNLTKGGQIATPNRLTKEIREQQKIEKGFTLISEILGLGFYSIVEAAKYLNMERTVLTYDIYHFNTYKFRFTEEQKSIEHLSKLLQSKLKMGKRVSHLSNPTSKYMGVAWSIPNKNWKVACYDSILKRKIHIGVYDNEEEAGAAYQKYVEEMKQRIIEDFNKIYNKNCGS